MEDIIDDFDRPLFYTDAEVFTQIWINPRRVLRYIHEHKFERYMTVLLILAGISRAFDRASNNDMGDALPLMAVVGSSILAGLVFGWLSAYIYAALVNWTGEWLDGQGDTRAILRVMAYASLPFVGSLFLQIPQIAIYGNEIFKANGDLGSAGIVSNLVFWGAIILELILSIWSVVFYVLGVSEVQQFGIGKSILNLLLPVLIFAVPIGVIALIYSSV